MPKYFLVPAGLEKVCNTLTETGRCRVVEDRKCETQYLLKYDLHCVPGPELCRTLEQTCSTSPDCETQYETVQETVCSPVTDEICTTSYQEKCRTEPGPDCGPEGAELCSTVYDIVSNIQCSEVQEKQCRTFYVPECETVQGPSLSLSLVVLLSNRSLQMRCVRKTQPCPQFRPRILRCRTIPWEK